MLLIGSHNLLKDMSDYYCITMNLVVLGVRYRRVKALLCASVEALVSIGRFLSIGFLSAFPAKAVFDISHTFKSLNDLLGLE